VTGSVQADIQVITEEEDKWYKSSSSARRDAGTTVSAEKLLAVPATSWRTGRRRRSTRTGLVSLSWG